MSNQIALLEKELDASKSKFVDVLKSSGLPVERLFRTIAVSCEITPKILDCERPSILRAAMSAAVLGLEVDGYTGQAYIIPFAQKAQLVIGYKGFNTLAARSGFVINGSVVREGDTFDFQEGTNPYLNHHREIGNESNRRIIAAWAVARSKTLPDIMKILSVDELMAVKAKSPGARKKDSPWNDPTVGLPAMYEKTTKRRIARGMPLNVMQLGAAMDQAFEEEGKYAHISPDKGLVVDGVAQPLTEPAPQPSAKDLTSGAPVPMVIMSDNTKRQFQSLEAWVAYWVESIPKVKTANIVKVRERNQEVFDAMMANPNLAEAANTVLHKFDEILAGRDDA